jgi:hypothetical protein
MPYMRKDNINPVELIKVFDYDPETGIIKWGYYPPRGTNPGVVAGRILNTGYVQITLHGKSYQAHRIAWAMHYREWPTNVLDHINGIRNDNRISNLRLSSDRDNQCNQIKHRNGGLVGATKVVGCKNRWKAKIKIDGVCVHIGSYDSEKEASMAYFERKRLLEEAEE